MRTFSQRLVQRMIERATDRFSAGEEPPRIQVFIEEAHNILGQDSYAIETGEMDPLPDLQRKERNTTLV